MMYVYVLNESSMLFYVLLCIDKSAIKILFSLQP